MIQLKQAAPGFNLIELMVAMSLFVMIASVAFAAVGNGQLLQSASLERGQALSLARQGMEASQSVANQDFSQLMPGTYGLTMNPSGWQFAPAPDQLNNFQRTITISPVSRDTNGLIVSSGGTQDPSTFKLNSTVSWQAGISHSPRQIALEGYVTDWSKPIVSSDLGWNMICGNQTVDGSELSNRLPTLLVWNEQLLNPADTSFSGSEPSKLTLLQAGDYEIMFNHPIERSDSRNRQSRFQSQLVLNGSLINGAVSRTAFISYTNSHSESSNQFAYLLRNVQSNDVIEIQSSVTNNYDSAIKATTTDKFCLFVRRISESDQVFSAQSTANMASTNLNNSSYTYMTWSPERIDSLYSHTTGSAQNITFNESGYYQVFINVPFSGSVSSGNVKGEVLINGSLISTGRFSQGYILNSRGDTSSSSHWFGVISASAGQELSVRFIREAASGTITIGSIPATISILKLPSDQLFVATGTTLTNGSNWNPASPGLIQWGTEHIINSSLYTHSTSNNSETIEITTAGDYFLAINAALTAASGIPNVRTTIFLNGQPIGGAQVKTFQISGSSAHSESSGTMAYVLHNLVPQDQISVQISREADTDTVNDLNPAQLIIWKQ